MSINEGGLSSGEGAIPKDGLSFSDRMANIKKEAELGNFLEGITDIANMEMAMQKLAKLAKEYVNDPAISEILSQLESLQSVAKGEVAKNIEGIPYSPEAIKASAENIINQINALENDLKARYAEISDEPAI